MFSTAGHNLIIMLINKCFMENYTISLNCSKTPPKPLRGRVSVGFTVGEKVLYWSMNQGLRTPDLACLKLAIST